MKTNKKVFLKLAALMIAVVITLGLSSCEKTDQNEPSANNFGTVIVTNNTGEVIWVDCFAASETYNDQRRLEDGDTTVYEMAPGRIREQAITQSRYEFLQEHPEYTGSCNKIDGSQGPHYSFLRSTDSYELRQGETYSNPWKEGLVK